MGVLLHPVGCSSFPALFPFYWMVITSVRPDSELYRPWNSMNYDPFWTWKPTWDHVRYLFDETLFASWLLNTTFIAIVSTADLARVRRVRRLCAVAAELPFRRAAWAPASSSPTWCRRRCCSFRLAEIIRNYRLGDTPWSLILTYPTFLIPFCTWLMMGYFKAVPKELEECARIDGASRLEAMFYIVIPVAVPGILSAGIFAFTLSWNEFIYALVFLSSLEQKTVPVGVTSELIRGDVFFWGPLMAGALLRIDPGRDRLFVLCRALRRRIDRIGEGMMVNIRRWNRLIQNASTVGERWDRSFFGRGSTSSTSCTLSKTSICRSATRSSWCSSDRPAAARRRRSG